MSVVTDTNRNGVDTEKLFATLDLIRAQPELARFQFRATNRWIGGAHNRSTIKGFYAAGGEDATRTEAFEIDAGEPAILLGTDTGANPAEHLLHALAACLTTSIVYVAAARKVELRPSIDAHRHGRARALESTTSRATGSSASACRSGRARPARSSRGRGAAPRRLRHGHQRRARRRRGDERLRLEIRPCRSSSQPIPPPAPASWRSPSSSPKSSAPTRPSTTAKAAIPSRRSTRSRPPATCGRRIVERALALSGGGGYLNGSPLARAYRDVKAGSFMHPLGANRAYDYLADVALGEATSLH